MSHFKDSLIVFMFLILCIMYMQYNLMQEKLKRAQFDCSYFGEVK